MGGISGNSSEAEKIAPNGAGMLLSAENILKTEPGRGARERLAARPAGLANDCETKAGEVEMTQGKAVVVRGEDSPKRARAPGPFDNNGRPSKKREVMVSGAVPQLAEKSFKIEVQQMQTAEGQTQENMTCPGTEKSRMGNSSLSPVGVHSSRPSDISHERMDLSPSLPPDRQDRDHDDAGSGGSCEKLQSSSAGSSGEEADIDSCGGSASGEMATRRAHKGRAAVVCKDGHVTPAVHQHEGDCVVASRLLALWNAAPVVTKQTQAAPKETPVAPTPTQQKTAAPVTC